MRGDVSIGFVNHETIDKNTCRNLAIASNGNGVCALSVGAYVIAIVDCVIVTSSALTLIHK